LRLVAAAGATTVALYLATGAVGAASRSGCAVGAPVGRGASQVWILRPSAPARSIVIYAHGWTATSPRDWHLARMNQLCAKGSIVVFPRYQTGSYADTFGASVGPFRRGLQAAFARLHGSRLPVVAAGYSFGATLVFYYAANATDWHLPVPVAVYSIFPTGPIPEVSLRPLPQSLSYVVLAGADDTVVGTAGPKALWRRLTAVPPERKEYRLVRSTADFRAQHEAPKEMTLTATRIFWAPLDALVVRSRR
jgi:acetyl esterase/lipase